MGDIPDAVFKKNPAILLLKRTIEIILIFQASFWYRILHRFIAVVIFLGIAISEIFANPGVIMTKSTYEVTVLDEHNKPLIGVSVYSDDMKFADYTDNEGKVILREIGYRDIVNFSYVGYISVKMPFYEIRKKKGVIHLYPDVRQLNEVVIVGRKDEVEKEMVQHVESISSKQIAFYNSQTTADVLQESGNVFVQKSQYGGGSPIIRGFESNKILLVLDGIRMNNAIYRSGHLQNSISVDNDILERIEVIYGPGSLTYGSDALGGVVHFRTKSPKLYFGQDKYGYRMETNVYGRFSSADLEKTAHFDINYGSKKWGALLGLTYSFHDDLRAGDKRPKKFSDFGKRNYYVKRVDNSDQVFSNPDYNIQKGTKFSQIDGLVKVKFQPSHFTQYLINLQYSTTSNVPRYDALTDTTSDAKNLKFAEWYYGPQKRLLASLKAKYSKPNFFYNQATLIFGFQKIDEDRLKRKLFKVKRQYNLEDVYIYTMTFDFDKSITEDDRNVLSYGVEADHNKVLSRAGKVNLLTEEVSLSVLSRYPAVGSFMNNLAGYMTYKWKSRDSSFVANAGVRYSHVELFSKFKKDDIITWPDEYVDPGIGTANGNVSWGVGFTFRKNNWEINTLAATAFRSPNIDDFSKIREKNGFVTIPNNELKPENAITGELSIGKKIDFSKSYIKLSTSGFYTHLTDAIVRARHPLPDGSDTLLIDDDEVLKTIANVNAENAFVYGVSGNLEINLHQKVKLKSGVNYTFGRTVMASDSLVPLAHIPPVYGKTSLAYMGEKLRLELSVKYNGAKAVADYAAPGSSDNRDEAYWYKDEEGMDVFAGTPAWHTINFHSSVNLGKRISFDFAVENITDLHYRPFSSGVSAPGRNFIVTLRGKF